MIRRAEIMGHLLRRLIHTYNPKRPSIRGIIGNFAAICPS